MVRTRRVSKIAITACLVCAPCLDMAVAAQTPSSSPIHVDQTAPPSRFTLKEPLTSRVTSDPAPPNLFADAEWGQRDWGYGHHHRNSGARTAIILGSVAAVAGAAVLVYANRPDCGANHAAGGCGYGTKVAGGAVLAGGVLGITIGAVTWR